MNHARLGNFGIALLIAAQGLGCSEEKRLAAAPVSKSGTPSADGGTSGSVSSFAGMANDGSGSSSAGPAAGGASGEGGGSGGSPEEAAAGAPPDAGSPEVVEVPWDEPSPSAVAAIKVIDSGQSPAFGQLGVLGSRAFAYSRDSLGLVSFGLDGSGLSSYVYGVIAAEGGESGALQVIFDDAGKLYQQGYDAALSPVGDSVVLASSSAGAVSLGLGGSQSLAVWAGTHVLEARLLGEGTDVALTIEEPLASVTSCQSTVTFLESQFSVVWSCQAADTSVWSARVGGDGTVSSPFAVFDFDSPLELRQQIRTPHGTLLLLNDGSARGSIVANLDATGALRGPLHHYANWNGQSMAVNQERVALIGSDLDGRTVVRSLHLDGSPASSAAWLDSIAPGGSGGVAAHGRGFLAIVRHENGSSWLVHLDGEGQPS